MNFSDACPRHQNLKHPKRKLVCVNELRNSPVFIFTHTRPPSNLLLFAAPRKSLLFVRGGMCVLFRACFSSLGDPGKTSALQPTLIFPDRVYEWLKIGGVVATTSVFDSSELGGISCEYCRHTTSPVAFFFLLSSFGTVPTQDRPQMLPGNQFAHTVAFMLQDCWHALVLGCQGVPRNTCACPKTGLTGGGTCLSY